MVSIYLNMVNYCNLACKYCYAEGGIYQNPSNTFNQELQESIAFAAIDSYMEHKQTNSARVIFFGGEPLLAFNKIQEIVKKCKEKENKRILFGIVTNGLGITKEIAAFLKKYNFLITVSFEGSLKTQEVRSRCDGTSSYEDVWNSIKIMENYGIHYNIRMTYTKSNILLKTRLESLQKLNHLKSIRAMMVSPTNSEVDIEEEDMMQYESELIEIAKKQPELLEKYEPVTTILKQYGTESNAVCCLMGLNGIAVDVNGDIYPCYRLVGNKKYVLGNIERNSKEIEYDWCDAFMTFGDKHQCNQCDKKGYCKNICYAENLYVNGEFDKIWEYRCREMEINKKAAEIMIANDN